MPKMRSMNPMRSQLNSAMATPLPTGNLAVWSGNRPCGVRQSGPSLPHHRYQLQAWVAGIHRGRGWSLDVVDAQRL
jgi:hypothetical protein